jgi:hypothetical protein
VAVWARRSSLPPVTQPEAGDPSHQVELGRVGQAQPDRTEDEALGAEVDVVDIQDLGDRVIAADAQLDVVQLQLLDVDELVAGPRRRGRHPALQHDSSMPSTRPPASTSGRAIRPVPTASSRASRRPASRARNATVSSSSPRRLSVS